jgi:hypothetical protein
MNRSCFPMRRADRRLPRRGRVATTLLVVMLAGLLAACGKAPPPAPPQPPPMTAVQKQNYDMTVGWMRDLERGLLDDGKATVDLCVPGAPDATRLTFFDKALERPFTLGISANPKGALAVWYGLRYDPASRTFALDAAQGMQLDVNGWRQVRGSVTDARFAALASGSAGGAPPTFGSQGGIWFIETCLDGQYRLVVRDLPYNDADADFARPARGMVRLAGSVYTFGEPVGGGP